MGTPTTEATNDEPNGEPGTATIHLVIELQFERPRHGTHLDLNDQWKIETTLRERLTRAVKELADSRECEREALILAQQRLAEIDQLREHLSRTQKNLADLRVRLDEEINETIALRARCLLLHDRVAQKGPYMRPGRCFVCGCTDEHD